MSAANAIVPRPTAPEPEDRMTTRVVRGGAAPLAGSDLVVVPFLVLVPHGFRVGAERLDDGSFHQPEAALPLSDRQTASDVNDSDLRGGEVGIKQRFPVDPRAVLGRCEPFDLATSEQVTDEMQCAGMVVGMEVMARRAGSAVGVGHGFSLSLGVRSPQAGHQQRSTAVNRGATEGSNDER